MVTAALLSTVNLILRDPSGLGLEGAVTKVLYDIIVSLAFKFVP